MIAGCGVRFQQVELYDVYENNGSNKLETDPIFNETKGTLWHSLADCGSFNINSDEAFSGNQSIAISWQKSNDCIWMGFGNTFNNWQPTDVRNVMDKKALRFYVKSQSDVCSSIPIVLALEDFYGGGSYLFVDTKKYLKGLNIDSTWKEIIVPFWHFPVSDEIENDDIDLSSIKQLKFQLEGSGSFYIDAIEVIDFSPDDYKKMLSDVEEMKPNGSLNQTIYVEGLLKYYAWGTGQKKCQDLREVTDSLANTWIQWQFDSHQCGWSKWGINWNDWYSINFRGVLSSNLSFRVKMLQPASFEIKIEDFNGHSASISIDSTEFIHSEDWQQIKIPLSKFEIRERNLITDRIKQIVFIGYGRGNLQLDDLKISDQ